MLSEGISIRSICIYHNGFHVSTGELEGILLGGRKIFALKLTISPKNNQCALKLTFFSLIRIGPETSCKYVLYS